MNHEPSYYDEYMWDILTPFFLVIANAVVLFILFYYYRTVSIVKHWADAHFYHLISIKLPLAPGPLWGETIWPKYSIIYYVTIETLDGERREAWIHCGRGWMSIFSNRVKVHWNENPSKIRGIKIPFW